MGVLAMELKPGQLVYVEAKKDKDLGSLRIDLNNVGGETPIVGEVLSVSGTQPLPSGLILGDARF
jgi:hypothetical protein